MKQDELRLGICLDQVNQEHWVGALDPRLAGVNLERELVAGTQFDEPPHDEVFERFHLLGRKLGSGMPKRLRGALGRDVLEAKRSLIGERRLEADRALLLWLSRTGDRAPSGSRRAIQRSSPRLTAKAYGSSAGSLNSEG